MAKVELPKSKFYTHPAGQHRGFIFEIEGPVAKETRYGKKMKIAFKIESETAMMPEDSGEYSGEPCTVWLWCTLSRSPKGNLRKYREKILGRQLTQEEIGADDFDAEAEFLNKRIWYVIEHAPGEQPGEVYANIETFGLDDDQAPCQSRILQLRGGHEGDGVNYAMDPEEQADLRTRIIAMEEKTLGEPTLIDGFRRKHLGTTDLSVATDEMMVKYGKVFSAMAGEEDDGLPFN